VLASTGYIYTVAGGASYPFCADAIDDRGDGCAATGAELDNPAGIAVDASGNLYIADSGDSTIREVLASTGEISVIAGNGSHGYSGDGGPATEAEFNAPVSVSFDSHGNMYVADANVDVVREISASTGYISTIAGTGTGGYSGDGLAATSAKLNTPNAAAVDSSGNVYIMDSNNCRVRLVTASSGDISTFTGTGRETYSGDGGTASDASIGVANDVVLDSSGNLYIADTTNYVIRAVGN
jgi:sugar lactone lactonase YvrE